MSLTREQFLSARDLRLVEVPVPEFGEGASIHVGPMTAVARERWETAVQKDGGDGNIRALLVIYTAVDPAGNRLFSESDLSAVRELSASAIDRIFTASIRVNRLGKEDMDELEEKSPAIQPSLSLTGSRLRWE